MFNIVEKKYMKEYEGECTLYCHDKTGMEVFHIKNNNTELCANFMFGTPSEDSTGVAHIIEHTVLCGSERYPVKDPFLQLYVSSPNTFLNAMTFPDKTMYPLASPLKKDFDILFDIYADAVFAPLLRKESFEQEGVRFFDNKIDGVVYNEMTGALSSEDAIVQSWSARKLFEGTSMEYESGGDPYYIATLTYNQYKERYERWYSPSNCRLFLFGDLNAEEYLNKIEEKYLNNAKVGIRYIPRSEEFVGKALKPSRCHQYCSSKEASDCVLTWLTKPSDNALDIMIANIVTDILLGNPGAPLYKAITDSELGEDLNEVCGIEADYPVITFSAGFTGAVKDKEDEIENFIINTLKDIVEKGLPSDMVEASMKRQEFRILEIQGDGYPFGIMTSLRCARSWMRGNSPFDGVSQTETFEKLKNLVKNGHFFEIWIKENLIENPKRCLLTVTGDSDFTKKNEAKLKERLQQMLENINSNQLENEQKRYNEFVEKVDSPEALATIDRIRLKDMPEKVPLFDLESKVENGAVFYELPTLTRGIVYLNMAFDTSFLTEEEKVLMPLLVRLMQMTGTDKHNYTELGTLVKFYTGSFEMSQYCGRKLDGTPVSYVNLRTKFLYEDLKKAIEVIEELISSPNLADKGRIEASLTDIITDFESDYTYSANSYASMYATSFLSSVAREADLSGGTRCWINMKKLKEDCKEGVQSLSYNLVKLYNKVFTSTGVTSSICCDDCNINQVRQIVSLFINRLKKGEKYRLSDFYNKDNLQIGGRLSLNLPSGPAYNSKVIKIKNTDQKTLVYSTVLSSILSTGYLWETIRGKNGAYGAGARIDLLEGTFTFMSYRDPQILKTYEAFDESLKQNFKDEEVEYCIVTILGKELRPLTPQTRLREAFRRVMLEMDDEQYMERRRIILSCKASDLEEVEALISGESCEVTVCGKDMVTEGLFSSSMELPN